MSRVTHPARLFWGFAVPVLLFLGLGWYFAYQVEPQSTIPTISSLKKVKRQVQYSLSLPFGKNGPEVPILMYHYIRNQADQINDPIGYGLSVPPAEFEQHLKWLKEAGYHSIHLSELLRGDYNQKSVILTFDDGYKDFITDAYPLLQQYGFTANIFVITGRLTDPRHLNQQDLLTLAANGIEIGSHSVGHVNLTTQSAANLERELVASKQTLENLLARPVLTISYPSGKYNENVVRAAINAGYEAAVTTDAGLGKPTEIMELKRVRIKRGFDQENFLDLIKRP